MTNISNEALTILGSTGSVGRQAIDTARIQGRRVCGIAASSDVSSLENQIREFRPELCAVADENAALKLKTAVADLPVKILAGADSASELASITKADVVLNAVTGFAGLKPTLSAIGAGKTLALANKESLVTAGEIVMRMAEEKGVRILPVDSEHCAIAQCLSGHDKSSLTRLILTASGGPFFGRTRAQLETVTAADALRHPTWLMGPKITVDSASLMNKGFEVIEAAYLFGVPAEHIDVVVHRESIIHSMAEYADMAVMAQLSKPDMRLCVSYAINGGIHKGSGLERLDLTKIGSLTFYQPDRATFKLLPLAYEAMRRGGIVPAYMNAVNEIAVRRFISGEIGFTELFDMVEELTLSAPDVINPAIADIVRADAEGREAARVYRSRMLSGMT